MASTRSGSRPGGRPAAKATGKPVARPTGKPAGKAAGRAAVGGPKKGAPPRGRGAAPIKPGLPWGVIGVAVVIVLFAAAVVGYGVYQVRESNKPASERIHGLVNFRKTENLARGHVTTQVKYPQSPPVGGNHNPVWQDCMGDVYTKPIANEHAVHSLEHGAVWITYNPSLSKKQVAELADKVRGRPYMLMSPYPGLRSPISLQAWGYQLKIKKASDKRIDEFIKAFRQTAGVEAGASCQGGTTQTGTALSSP